MYPADGSLGDSMDMELVSKYRWDSKKFEFDKKWPFVYIRWHPR